MPQQGETPRQVPSWNSRLVGNTSLQGSRSDLDFGTVFQSVRPIFRRPAEVLGPKQGGNRGKRGETGGNATIWTQLQYGQFLQTLELLPKPTQQSAEPRGRQFVFWLASQF